MEELQKEKEKQAFMDEIKKNAEGKGIAYDDEGQILIVTKPNFEKQKPLFGLPSQVDLS